MTITRRDSDFLAAPSLVPTNTSSLLNSYEKTLDPTLLALFRAVINDFDNYKTSMIGITRRFDNMLFIYNFPNQKQADIQEAVRMDKYGNFAFGTEYPRWPRCKLDINGALYAIPQFGIWEQQVDLAGLGLYTWGVEIYNPNTDIFSRTGANTTIRIDEPGTYDVRAVVVLEAEAASPVALDTYVTLNHNANIIKTTIWPRTRSFLVSHVLTAIVQNVARGDTFDVELVAPTPVGSNRKGDGTNHYSSLNICKVN